MMGRFVLPKTMQARNWIRSTDALRNHLLARRATVKTRAAELRRQADEVEREYVEIDQAIALLDQLLPPKTLTTPAPIATLPASSPQNGQSKRWSLMHDACTNCGRSSVKHMARGLCATCYQNDAKEKAAAAS